MSEKWAPVKGFEDRYKVSTSGRVYSHKRKMFLKSTSKRYPKVVLHKKGKLYNFLVHRLVANAFIPNPQNKKQINHINGNKHDNRVENLEWCTQSENMLHAFSLGLEKPRQGEEHHNARLTEKEVIEIFKSKEGTNKLAARYSIAATAVSKIRKRQRWKHLTKDL